MGITVNTSPQQITASVGETQIDVAVSGGFGPSGNAGAPGQAASVTVGTVTTGAAGSQASVINVGTSNAAVLNFTIPAGATGATGPQGPAGAAGASAWADITGKPTFAAVATSGAYSDLTGRPTLGTAAAAATTDFAAASHTQAWATITGTPTTLAGYGITDAAAASHAHSGSDITSGTVAVARLGSGSPSSANFLRGDGTWAAAGSTNASDLTSGTLAYARIADPTVTSPSQITASQNDYASFARGINRISSDAARDITGIAAGTDGQAILLVNVGSFAITLKHQSTSSSAANRLIVPWESDYLLDPSYSALIVYDSTTARWRVI